MSKSVMKQSAQNPPLTKLHKWLKASRTDDEKTYLHVLLTELSYIPSAVWNELFVYINNAHEGDILLDPRKIKQWFDTAPAQETDSPLSGDDFIIPIKPLVDIKTLSTRAWRVLPVIIDNSVKWYDVAGYLLAISTIPEKWDMLNNRMHNYSLDTHKNIVIVLLE